MLPSVNYTRIPLKTMSALQAYVEQGRPVGQFLQAVLGNDLLGSYARAGPDDLAALGDIMAWLYWEAPASSWGNYERYVKWTNSAERAAQLGARKEMLR